MEDVIELSGVSFKYPQSEKNALSGVSFCIKKGDYVAVVGANGSGKSTLSRLLAGFLDPTEGSVTRSPEQLPGIVFQHPKEQIVAGVVERDTAFGPQNLHLSKGETELRTMECLSVVDLADRAFSRTAELSLGQIQRLALAGILALFPDLLILDETTAMLDPSTRHEVIAFISQWNKKGNSVIHVTHDKDEAFNAERVLVLAGGKLVFDGSSKDFASDTNLVDSVFAPDTELYEHKKNFQPKTDEPYSLVVDGLSFSYEDRAVFKNVSFALKKGSLTAITGPSGCGKSTMLECLAGLLKPEQGKVYASSKPLLSLQDSEATLFEQFAADDVAFGPRTQGLVGKELKARVKNAMDAAGVPFADFADRETFRLSGGEQRKVSIAGILALEGDVYLFDEPTAALDSFSRKSVLMLLRNLASSGKTVLFSTHRREEAVFADEELSWDSLTKNPQRKISVPEKLTECVTEKNAATIEGIRKTERIFMSPPKIPKSPVSMLPPVLKYIIFLALFSATLVFKNIIPCAIMLGANILYALLARYSLLKPLKAVVKIFPWLLLIVVFQLVFFPAQANEIRYIDARWFMVTPSKIMLCACSLLRIFSCIICMGVFIFTTDERAIMDGLAGLLFPLSLIKIPVRYAVLVVGIIFRFIPLLMDEAVSIIKTQIIRGAFGSAKGFGKLKMLVPLFAPLMIQTFRKAEVFAEALTARYFS